MSYDVAVIGAGVVGALVARELTKLNIRVALLEKRNDVAMGATKANSAIVHGGFDAKPGTLKAKLNVEGTALMPLVCNELNVPFGNNGSLVLGFDEEDMETLRSLLARAAENNVPGVRIIDREELLEMEPNIAKEAVGALVSATAGIVCPYELTIAAVENAVENGLSFIRNCEVQGIDFADSEFVLHTTLGDIRSQFVVNAAGAYAGDIARMIGDESVRIQPRLGEYYLLDRAVGLTVTHTVFQCPGKMGKGILVSPTVDGNLLIGPTALDMEEFDNVATTAEGLEKVKILATKSVPSVSAKNAITSFAGLRAHPLNDDFIIDYSPVNRRFIHAAGIESPGLSASPAIAKYVRSLLLGIAGDLQSRNDFDPVRRKPVRFRALNDKQREELIAQNRAYGRIVCRCEMITEGEIVDAIHAPAGARDVDGVKRRTRAGMGRCQGGFCGSKVVEILARELNVPLNEITKFGGGSDILYDKTK
ncbi:MAG: NAD(P)/FAD-dependent oxidoreductase [Oscillospiraceae bacterium]|jgi:glycerol-3-phosphate dehydrogenase|nr:NAD(P)/FAD-dependent oxidoreductase [Oscillospiraceae bacterium]